MLGELRERGNAASHLLGARHLRVGGGRPDNQRVALGRGFFRLNFADILLFLGWILNRFWGLFIVRHDRFRMSWIGHNLFLR